MPDYAYAEVTVGLKRGAKAVRLESTDEATVRQMAAEVKELIPSCRVQEGKRLPSGEAYTIKVDRLGEGAVDVAWWMLKELCLDGWEPLGAWQPFDWSFNTLTLDKANVRNWQLRKRLG